MENRLKDGQVMVLPKSRERAARMARRGLASALMVELHAARGDDAAATGFLLALLAGAGGPVLWVQDHLSQREGGRLHMPGLRALGIGAEILQVRTGSAREVLRAMEEGAACAALAAVVGEIHGAPGVLDFTATKRLALRAKASGVPVYLLRGGDGARGLSAARTRWRIASLPSRRHGHDPDAPGAPQWEAELFRAGTCPPGRWIARYDPERHRPADRLRLVSGPDDGTVAAGDQPRPERSGG